MPPGDRLHKLQSAATSLTCRYAAQPPSARTVSSLTRLQTLLSLGDCLHHADDLRDPVTAYVTVIAGPQVSRQACLTERPPSPCELSGFCLLIITRQDRGRRRAIRNERLVVKFS
ncbi:hypothetical protein Bbelb_289330 [Branchiostoma belcheri]|nr:hypothetical protein Bbelb_289330 [Branchiostoma belcheri]